MSKNHKEAVEITTFKLKGYTSQKFIKENEDVDAFLRSQSGFKSRRIFEQGSIIVDMLFGTVWRVGRQL